MNNHNLTSPEQESSFHQLKPFFLFLPLYLHVFSKVPFISKPMSQTWAYGLHHPFICKKRWVLFQDGNLDASSRRSSLIKGEGFITVIHHFLSLSLWGGGKRTSAQKGRDYPLDLCNHPVLLRFPLCRLSCLLPPSTITHGKTTPQERGAGFQSQDRFAPHH